MAYTFAASITTASIVLLQSTDFLSSSSTTYLLYFWCFHDIKVVCSMQCPCATQRNVLISNYLRAFGGNSLLLRYNQQLPYIPMYVWLDCILLTKLFYQHQQNYANCPLIFREFVILECNLLLQHESIDWCVNYLFLSTCKVGTKLISKDYVARKGVRVQLIFCFIL